jgi:hypothetical protein
MPQVIPVISTSILAAKHETLRKIPIKKDEIFKL